jgi:glycoprotein-N-acetylgalactosamine 3-beta-galactosyltransferase
MKIFVGTKCKASTKLPSTFLEKFSEYHLQRNEDSENPNFEKLMLFDFKLVMKMKYDDLADLYELGNELMTTEDHPNNRPILYTHVSFGPYLDRWIPLNQSYFSGVSIYRSIDVTQQGEIDIMYVQFHFDYKIAWSPDFKPSVLIPVSLNLDLDDFRQRLTMLPNDDPRHATFNKLEKSFHLIIETISVSYVVQPKKFDFSKNFQERCADPNYQQLINERILAESNRDPCHLLGTNCGVVLRRLQFPKDLPIHEVSPWRPREIPCSPADEDPAPFAPSSDKTSLPRIFCGIFTKASNHQTYVRTIHKTWARKCTAFLAFSTVDDPVLPSINLPHIGEETYGNMWQKSRSIWKYIATHYLKEFDWFLLGGDDMYYVMENLYSYITSDEIRHIQQHYGKNDGSQQYHGLYLGRMLTEPASSVFNATMYNTGGPGYLLDFKALQVLRDNIDESHCYPFSQHSGEDVYLGDCLIHSNPSVVPYNTTDHLGRHRFLLYPAGPSFTYNVEERKAQKHWVLDYDPHVKGGHDCCSDDIISIHFLNPEWMLAMDDFFYRCPRHDIDSYYATHGLDFFDREVIAEESGRRK